MTQKTADYGVIFFDGECNLCNRFVQYVIRHDKRNLFRFSPLQSSYALSKGLSIPVNSDGSLESMLVEWNGKVYNYSEGVLKVLENLSGINRMSSVFRILPRGIRDRLYRWVAKRRYFFFGKAKECAVATPELQARFLQ
jgi:predicted DCC family thiol-disulfide oxidoreductase YuxK